MLSPRFLANVLTVSESNLSAASNGGGPCSYGAGGQGGIFSIISSSIWALDSSIYSAIASSKGIVPIFLWQPIIFSVSGSQLTERESFIIKNNQNSGLNFKKLSELTYQEINKSSELLKYNFFNLSHSLDTIIGKPHFYDFCHVSEDANKVIAEKTLEILKKFIPERYHAKA